MMQFKTFCRRAAPVLAGLFFLSVWLVPHALAQSDDRLDNLSIQVWPEYDNSSVLVQYDGELASKDKLPRDVSVLIPTGAQLNATAYVATNGDFLNTDSPTVADAGGGFTRVTFKLPSAKFHIEYYYNPLQGSPDKTMEFDYKSAQAADNVQLEIQQPLKADKFVTDPTSPFQTTDAHKFTYHQFNYATLNADQVVRIKVSYTKSDPNPSISNLPKPSSASTPADVASSAGPNQWLPAVLAALALALVVLGVYYWWTKNRGAHELVPAAVSPSRRSQRRSGSSGGASAGSGFCTQCGRALKADENFCPRCGTPRRKG